MPLPKTPTHHQAEAAFKPQTAEVGEGLREYVSNQATKLANMERLRAQRLAREADKSASGTSKSLPRRKARKRGLV